MMYVQFSDSEHTKIVTMFLGPQDPEVWANLGEVDEDDSRYLAFVESLTPSPEITALSKRDSLLTIAALRISPLEDAVELGDASADEKASLLLWRKYRVALNRISLQAGYPGAIDWPVAPE